jgi:hypothetical protein
VELQQSANSTYQTLCVQIGDVRCALRFKDARLNYNEIFHRVERLYRPFLTKDAPDITVDLEGTDTANPATLDAALAETRFLHEDNTFQTSSNLIAGQYDLTHSSIHIVGEKWLVDPELEINHLNRLLSLAYYSACKVKYNGNPPAMLVHACGILRRGHVFLFVGPSEAGKTTVARLCGNRDGEVIHDEMLLVSRSNSQNPGVKVQSAPMLGRFPSRKHITAPLAGILLLKKGNLTQVRPIEKTEAYLRFIRQIISPAYIGQKDRREVYSLMADFSNEVTGAVPMYELEFSLDKKALWKTIEKFEEQLAE